MSRRFSHRRGAKREFAFLANGEITACVDLMFTLLIFFMLSSSFLTPALRLDLPKAVKHDRDEPQQVVISIERDGGIFMNTTKTSLADLKGRLENRFTAGGKKSVHLRGDKEMPYKYFVQVMDAARQAGAQQINIVHEEAKTG